MTDHKRITGQKAIDILQCIPRDLINYMREGLTAFHEDGSEVYDLDDPDTGPGWVEHLQATRRHTINEMRVVREETRMAEGCASATVPEFPDGWLGMSFTADETLEKVKGLYFQLKDIEAIRERLESPQKPKKVDSRQDDMRKAEKIVREMLAEGLDFDDYDELLKAAVARGCYNYSKSRIKQIASPIIKELAPDSKIKRKGKRRQPVRIPKK